MSTTPTDAGAEVTAQVSRFMRHTPLCNILYSDSEECSCGMYAARDALAAALAGDGWVKLSERKPDVDAGLFLCHLKDGDQMITYWERDHDTHEAFWLRRVTHWRPLPKGPAMDATREGEG